MSLPEIIKNTVAKPIAAPLSNWKHYIFYPLALAGTLAFIYAEVGGLLGPLGKAYPLYLLALISIMVAFGSWINNGSKNPW
jgi:hypothetical protein